MVNCPHCTQELDDIGVQSVELVFRRLEIIDGEPEYRDEDTEPIAKDKDIFYCPYCNEELDIDSEAEAIAFLKGEKE